MGELEDLRSEITSLPTAEGEAEVTPDRVWSFIREVIAAEPVACYYLSPFPDSSSYAGVPNSKLQVVVFTDRLAYDFIFSADTARYDVTPISLIGRIDERRQLETSVDGPPREKVMVQMEFGDTDAMLHLVAFGEKGRQLSAFVEQVRRLAFRE